MVHYYKRAMSSYGVAMQCDLHARQAEDAAKRLATAGLGKLLSIRYASH